MPRLSQVIQAVSRVSAATTAEFASWRNPAAVLHRANDLRFEHHDLPEEIPRGSVRVGIRALGICASDLHYLHEARAHSSTPLFPAPSRVGLVFLLTPIPSLPELPCHVQGRIGKAVVNKPMVIGHETAG